VPLGTEAGLTVTGTSSLVMVTKLVGTVIVALVAPNRPTLKISFASGTISPMTGTVIVRETWPGVKVSVPLVLV
jgi:hypothetical protein